MKGPLDRTKVVIRHLPPTISQSMLMEQVDTRFAGRYNWVSFRPGKNSQKRQFHSIACINFKRPEDVIEFAEFFDGHVFVNEKAESSSASSRTERLIRVGRSVGRRRRERRTPRSCTQFRAMVEYAPSQCVSKQWSKKDGREGTIFKDPEYLEFLEFIAKPIENLPSAEIQLERKEAERVGTVKDAPVITPLMDYIRQKRAAKGGTRRSLTNGRQTRRASGASTGFPSSASSKRGSERRRVSAAMYVLRDTAKSTSGQDKSTYVLVSKRDDQQLSDKSVPTIAASGAEMLEEESDAYLRWVQGFQQVCRAVKLYEL
ncbi:unnamed protein product [Ilex paraguariensis]|uniref:UPF3 domain-containing protein n=1 Tax=Ilex paraguariensis TaxID=185542 RepID=A0ABC8SMR7_9AQUA